MNHQLANKRALVTGGSRGIEAVIVKRLKGEGAHLALLRYGAADEIAALVGRLPCRT